MNACRVVVGAAILRDGRVLSARRSRPEALAGGWEFPGGKVEAGESEREALVRECREELGVGIVCTGRLPGEWWLSSALVLKVFLAELVDGEPAAGDSHDELRWLDRDAVFDVDWLPADLPAAVAVCGFLGNSGPPASG
jgi:8-oxo-dGTP diphosphatase